MNININKIYEWPMSRRVLVLLLILAITIYAGYWWDLSSLRVDLSSSREEEQDFKQQLQTIMTKQANLKNELAQLPKIQAFLADWKKKLVKTTDLPEAMNEILKIGGNNQLNFILFSPGEEAIDENYIRLPIKTIVVGSYHQIGTFISQLANMKWIVVVRNFNISNENKNDLLGTKLAEQANAQGLLTAELGIELYKIPDPGELDKLKSKDAKPGLPGAVGPTSTTPSPPTTPPATPPSGTTPNAP